MMSLGDFRAAHSHLEAGLALAQQSGDDRNGSAALYYLGEIACDQGDWPQAQAYLEQSLALARKANDQTLIASVSHEMGWVDLRQGRYPHAQAYLAESKTPCQAHDNRLGLIDALIGLGGVTLFPEEYEQARELYLEGLTLARQASACHKIGAALNCLGEVARLQRDYAAAPENNLSIQPWPTCARNSHRKKSKQGWRAARRSTWQT